MQENAIMHKADVMNLQALRTQMNGYYWINKASAVISGCDAKQQSTNQPVKMITTELWRAALDNLEVDKVKYWAPQQISILKDIYHIYTKQKKEDQINY